MYQIMPFVAQGESAAAPAEPGQKTPLNDVKTPQISTTQLKCKKHATLQNRTPDLPPMEQRNTHCLTARLLRQPSLAYKTSQRDPRRIDNSRPLQYPANLQINRRLPCSSTSATQQPRQPPMRSK
ncbi:unnamed protein product [Heligmosomoides polygyrus]|uniref:Uncharacterized protein n=1 Tax=Heligmosomoides polygyrus TaxID=6339 RepID=A0A183FLS2_HELPZ|nr:unnamed protein product [Heligmosomoides polygyrus]